jgi:hypothetical protein
MTRKANRPLVESDTTASASTVSQPNPRTATKGKPKRIDLLVSSRDLKRWRASAGISNMTLSEWIREACNAHALDADELQMLRDAVDAAYKNAHDEKFPT